MADDRLQRLEDLAAAAEQGDGGGAGGGGGSSSVLGVSIDHWVGAEPAARRRSSSGGALQNQLQQGEPLKWGAQQHARLQAASRRGSGVLMGSSSAADLLLPVAAGGERRGSLSGSGIFASSLAGGGLGLLGPGLGANSPARRGTPQQLANGRRGSTLSQVRLPGAAAACGVCVVVAQWLCPFSPRM